MENAIFINSPYLGGAERSIINQALMLDGNITFFIPYLNHQSDAHDVVELVKDTHKDAKIKLYHYPENLYSVSRSGQQMSKATYMIEILNVALEYKKLGIGKYHVLWGNGNKVSFPLLLASMLLKLKSTLIWHLRDYPFNSGIFKVIWKTLSLKSNGKTFVVANSYDVLEKAKKAIKGKKIEFFCLYNPVGSLIQTQKRVGLTTIGAVSMIAPWKGLHDILNCEKKYRDELKDLGIEKIKIFGGDIYATSGEHQNYASELKDIIDDQTLVSFEGKKKPQEIYNSIDCIIHSSIKPEPFGRVIVEAFSCGLPVISTGLGGSGELVLDRESGYRYIPGDIDSLFKQIKDMIENKENRLQIIDGGFKKLKEVENQQDIAWRELKSKL